MFMRENLTIHVSDKLTNRMNAAQRKPIAYYLPELFGFNSLIKNNTQKLMFILIRCN